MVAFGQGPYSVLLHGTIAGCTANSVATINSTTGSLPTITDMESSVGSNCTFDVSFFMDTQSGGFVVSTLCSGLIVADSVFYTASEFDSTQVFIVLNCGGSNADCEGVVGGPALPGTPCDDGDPNTVYDQWTPSCECVGGPLQPCNACFYYDSVSIGNGSVPFTIASTNCSSGGVTPYTYLYDFGDGETSIGEDVVHTYATGGNYNICMTLSDANGCTNTTCDSVVIGANGSINPVFFYDCEGLLNGPNTYGTPCSVPGTNEPGVWNYACSCIPDSIYYTCQAGFYAVQAYVNGDTSGTPIPNEVWVWNASMGNGTPTYTWDFGDGTISTEEYPVHDYATNGPYQLCLNMAVGTACTSTYCDSISIGPDGLLEGLMIAGGHSGQLVGSRSEGFTLNVLQEMPTSISTVPDIAELNVWPNPVGNELNLDFNSIRAGSSIFSVINTDGRTVLQEERTVVLGKNTLELNTASLAPGLYLLRMGVGAQHLAHRFLKVQ